MKRLLPLVLAACAAPPEPPVAADAAPPPAMQLRAALPVRVDGVIYEVRRTVEGVAVAGLDPRLAGQEATAAAAVRAICGAEPGAGRWQGAEHLFALAACAALDG